MGEFTHYSVLLNECIEGLNIRPDGVYLDGTLGRAGHSREIARRLTTGRLICVDRDDAALAAAEQRLADWMDRVTLVHSNFDRVDEILDELSLAGADGMLFDLGVSSPQLDDGSRGFSYMADAPLDMRMDRSEGLTAADVVNGWSQEELRRILFQYGEERWAPQIAAAIVKRRADRPIVSTLELVDVIKGAMPARALKEKQHPAKRSFQAIRIAVNDELTSVERMIRAAVPRLNEGGRLAVIKMCIRDRSMTWVGLLVINSLLVLPGAAARNVARNMRQYHLVSLLSAVLAGVAGLMTSYYLGSSAGASITLYLAGWFLFTFFVRKRG